MGKSGGDGSKEEVEKFGHINLDWKNERICSMSNLMFKRSIVK
jgi:hypothetical protein